MQIKSDWNIELLRVAWTNYLELIFQQIEQLKGMKSISSLLQAYLVASFLSLRVEIEEIIDTNLSTKAAQLNSHKGATA